MAPQSFCGWIDDRADARIHGATDKACESRMTIGTADSGGSRGRILMLVDNAVNGDSRVQKSAKSAAAAGWDVTLLGIQGAATEHEWRIGDAEVRLLPVKFALSPHYSQIRRSWMRRPLAYPPGRTAAYRQQLIKGRRADIRARLAQARARRQSGAAQSLDFARVPWLRASSLYNKALQRWVRLRSRESDRLRDAQRSADAPINKIAIGFWRSTLGRRSWRRLDPGLWDYELAFGPAIDRMQPDIIHANDFRMLGVAVRAAARARSRGRVIRVLWDAHESVEGIMGRSSNPRWLPAQIEYVREYAPQADAVVTVSPTLAEMLRTSHSLPESPVVVLNAPVSKPDAMEAAVPVGDLRSLCGIDETTHLLVYCGGVNPRRGLDTMIDALPLLPGVHVAFVTLHPNGANAPSEALLERAAGIGVADRVHLLPYVGHWQVSQFLSTADAGVIPIQHQPNHEIALITKFFEFSQGRLPIIVSDVQTMADTVRTTGQGEVFTAQDVDSYVAAVRAVLADPQRYRKAYDEPGLLTGWTWEAQVDALDEVYSRLMSRS
jgi:glycosyltransferase involved in cell wall biosynthesis